ncbi:MAG: Asd/ArgC dimerization domain-containing protein [Gemmatimonadetes bacterium]|nr:Asd/ArgC dimerization domain-containing protein [Gemmatimonadota bacterium]
MTFGRRIPVAVLGATGLVGQRIVQRLASHPRLVVAEVVASARAEESDYGGVTDWALPEEMPDSLRHMRLKGAGEEVGSALVLSALPGHVAATVELALVEAGHVVCTNASAHRMRPDVPLIVPEVNPGMMRLVREQPWRAQAGALIANPNCVVAGLALALAPIQKRWGVRGGCHRHPAGDVRCRSQWSERGFHVGERRPTHRGEAEKIPLELNRILGITATWSVAVNRVPVLDGHVAHVFLDLDRAAHPEEVEEELEKFRGPEPCASLASLPDAPLYLRREDDRPKPRLDVGRGGGMTVTVAQVRRSPPHGLALTILVHTTVRGAAGACIANAELAVEMGFVGRGFRMESRNARS